MKPRRADPEHAEAVALIQWRDLMVATDPRLERLRHLYHIPNGGARSKAEGGRLKAEGVQAGVSDYCLPVPMPRGLCGTKKLMYGACYIELKPPGRQPTERQHQFLHDMQTVGNFAAWCVGWEECAAVLRWYLLADTPRPKLRSMGV